MIFAFMLKRNTTKKRRGTIIRILAGEAGSFQLGQHFQEDFGVAGTR